VGAGEVMRTLGLACVVLGGLMLGFSCGSAYVVDQLAKRCHTGTAFHIDGARFECKAKQ